MFTVGYLCRILSRLHRWRIMVDNYFVSNANRRRVRRPWTSAYRRGGCRRVIPTDRTILQILGQSSSLLHVERDSPCHFDGKSILIRHNEAMSQSRTARYGVSSLLYSVGSQYHNIQEQRLPGTVLLSSHEQRLLGCVGKATRGGDSADTDTHDTGSGCHTDVSILE